MLNELNMYYYPTSEVLILVLRNSPQNVPNILEEYYSDSHNYSSY